MFKTIAVGIKGSAPFVMHNGRLADPLDPFSRELKRLNPKAKKSDEVALVRDMVEWCGGLYHTAGAVEINDGIVKFDKKCKPILPADSIKSCIVEGARKAKLGKQAKAGVLVELDAEIKYNGPQDLNKLQENPNFVFRKMVRIGQSRIMRTRPVFRAWSAELLFEVDAEVMNEDQVIEALMTAGRYSGIGDHRPEYGRFEIVK